MLRTSLIVISCSLLLAACSKSSDAPATDAASAQAEASADASSATTAAVAAAGTQIQSGSDLSVPADFPTDVHVPDGQSISNVVKVGPTTSLVFALDAAPASLMKDIESKMTAQGWTTTMSMQTGSDGSMLAFSKPERTAMYTLSLHDGKAQLALQHTQTPQ